MAWFNNNEPVGAEVTGERMLTLLTEKLGFQVNADDDKERIYAYVNGVPLRFDTSPAPFAFYINATCFEQAFPTSRYDELLEWVSVTNEGTHFVTGYVKVEDAPDGDKVLFACDASVVVEAGLSDEQFESVFDQTLTSVLLYVRAFADKFELTIEGLTDRDDQQD